MSSSIHPTMEVATRMDDGFGYAAATCDIVATPGHATPATGALDTPSSFYSLMDVAIGCASPVNVVAAPAPLPLTSGTAPVGSWRVCRRARLFFGVSLRRVPHPPML